ncbi:MAG TPA: 2-oxoglutarate and iron-dependent oxygenase domain-containing protein [Thermosynechococcaceae cyanobacterium]
MAHSAISTVPLIDFAPFVEGDRAARQQVAAEIYAACQEVGFMYLRNSGISEDLVDRLFAEAKQFFALPAEVKEQGARSDATNCGYIGFRRERLNPANPWDLKEAFNVGKESVWATQTAFQQVMLEFYELGRTVVSPQVLRAFAIALQLPEDFFAFKHGQNHFLRLLHYPPLTAAPEAGQLRAGEHTDYGSITLLLQDAIGGLEVRTRTGEWIAAPPIPGTIVVNVGDAMQRWTNDRLCSTPHRVRIPTGEDAGRSRYSVALFCDPNPDVELACLESCHSPDCPARYAPILAGDYLASRLAATY